MTSETSVQPAAPRSSETPPQRILERFAGAYLTRTRMTVTLGGLCASTVLVGIIATAFGSVHISLLRVFHEPFSPDHAILMSARLPRVLMGATVGAVLAT